MGDRTACADGRPGLNRIPAKPASAAFSPRENIRQRKHSDERAVRLLAKAAAEEFIGGDPFVVSGVVRNPSIRGWNEVLS